MRRHTLIIIIIIIAGLIGSLLACSDKGKQPDISPEAGVAPVPVKPDPVPQKPDPAPPTAAHLEWLLLAYGNFMIDPCAGIVMLRRDHERLSDGLLAELHKAKNMAYGQANDWAIARGAVINGGGPDVGRNDSAMPLFSSLADHIAGFPDGNPPYPELFTSSAEPFIRHTIGTDELYAALSAFPAFVPWLPTFKANIDMGRAAGLPEEEVRRVFLEAMLPLFGLDACLAVPRDRFDALYPGG